MEDDGAKQAWDQEGRVRETLDGEQSNHG